MCLFAECGVNVLCKYFILHSDPVRDQSRLEKEIHPHASSWCTVRVRPNGTIRDVYEIHSVECREAKVLTLSQSFVAK
jgi:hypothetical protein